MELTSRTLLWAVALISVCPVRGEDLSAEHLGADPKAIREEFARSLGERMRSDLYPVEDFPAWFARKKKACSFGDLCSYLKTGQDKPYLYKSSDGGEIFNYQFLAAEQVLNQCARSVRDKQLSNMNAEQRRAAAEKAKEKGRQRKASLLEAFDKLQESIDRHNERADLLKLERTFREILLSDDDDAAQFKDLGEDHADDPASRQLFETYMQTLERRSGVQLSGESRGLYVNLLYLNDLFPRDADDVYWEDEVTYGSEIKDPFVRTAEFAYFKDGREGELRVRENQSKLQKQFDRSFGIFQQVQSDIVGILEKRRTRTNAAAIKSMTERISTIRLRPSQDACGGPNAYYSPLSHEFVLCPEVLNMPSATLKTIIAHELGHSIDPCIVTGALVQPSPKVAKLLAHETEDEDQTPEEREQKRAKKEKYKEQLGKVLDSDRRVLGEQMIPFALVANGQAERTEVYAADVLELDPNPLKVLAASVLPDKNPLASVVACLKTAGSVRARVASRSEINSQLEAALQRKKESGAADDDEEVLKIKRTQSKLTQLMKDKGACSSLSDSKGKSQLQEAFSDWVAGEVMAKDLVGKSPAAKAQTAYESMAFFVSMGCGSLKAEIYKKAKATSAQLECEKIEGVTTGFLDDLDVLDETSEEGRDEHPFDRARVERIFLAQPDLKKALGCQNRDGAKHCE